jgi:alkyl hydroperoxide reductase subunit AhpF
VEIPVRAARREPSITMVCLSSSASPALLLFRLVQVAPDKSNLARSGLGEMMKPLLDENIQNQVRQALSPMEEPVHILFFGSKNNCEYCDDTRQLLDEVTSLSDKLSLGVHDIDSDPDLARQYGVDKTPGIVLAGKKGDVLTDFGIRFAGIPAGHEFSSLIQDLLLVSSRDSGLSQATKDQIKMIHKPVLLQVFATPT